MHSYTLLGKPYVRIAALPTDRFPSDGKSVSAFAKTVLSNLSLRSVLASSTPTFYSAITKAISDGAFDDQTVVPKINRSALKYLSRLTSRATPFSTYATVGVLGDFAWSADNLDLVISQKQILERVPHESCKDEQLYTFNQSVHISGDRVYIPSPSKDQETISVRFSAAVESVKQITEGQIVSRELIASQLEEKFGTSDGLDDFIDGLISAELLLSFPTSYKITRWNEENRSSENITSSVQLFSLGKFSGTLPIGLINDTAKAIELMGRLFSFSSQNRNIESFTNEFISRYGNFRFPASQIIDNYDGIGTLPPLDNGSLELSEAGQARFELTNRLLTEILVANQGESSVDLSKFAGRIVENWPPIDFASSYDVIVKIESNTSQAGDSKAQFVLDDIGTIPFAGRAMARFAELSSIIKQNHQKIVDAASCLEGAERLPLLYRYNSAKPDFLSGNLSVSGSALSLGYFPHATQDVSPVNLSDISLFELGGKMYCFDEKNQQIANIHTPGLVNQDLLSGVARTLVQISQMNTATPYWRWLTHDRLTNHLPEIRLGDMILCREKWRLTNSQFASVEDLKLLLVELGIPRYIYTGASDNKILLDTEIVAHLQLLKHVIEFSDEDIWIERGVSPNALGITRSLSDPNARYATELVLSIASDEWDGRKAPTVSHLPPVGLEPDLSKRSVLDSATAFTFVVFCNESNQDRLLSTAFSILDDSGLKGYFVRYFEKGHASLRIRVKGGFDDVFIRSFCDLVLAQRLASDIEFNLRLPEFSRYGGTECFSFLEQFWCLESAQIVKNLNSQSLDSPEQILTSRYHYLHCLVRYLGFDIEYVSAVADSYENEFVDDRHSVRKAARDVRDFFTDPTECHSLMPEMTDLLTRFLSCELEGAVSLHDVKQSIVHLSANRLGLTRRDEAVFWRALFNRLRALQFGGTK